MVQWQKDQSYVRFHSFSTKAPSEWNNIKSFIISMLKL